MIPAGPTKLPWRLEELKKLSDAFLVLPGGDDANHFVYFVCSFTSVLSRIEVKDD
jgi:hypothetical protein